MGGSILPIFFGSAILHWFERKQSHPQFLPNHAAGISQNMSWSEAVERTVTGMGYDLVDVERSGGGLLRVTIDRLPGRTYLTGDGEFVLVEDCEAVTRQLRAVLDVENLDYKRLEVSSPGLDRPLKRPQDFERFAGQKAEVTFKEPFQGRKKFQGELRRHESGWCLVFEKGEVVQQLDFRLDELREARLVPVLDFKGRRRKAEPAVAPGASGQSDDGGKEE